MTGEVHDAAEVRAAAAELTEAEETLLRRALSLLLTERELNGDERAVATLMQKRAALYFACRRVTRAVDAVGPAWQPRGWRDDDREASPA